MKNRIIIIVDVLIIILFIVLLLTNCSMKLTPTYAPTRFGDQDLLSPEDVSELTVHSIKIKRGQFDFSVTNNGTQVWEIGAHNILESYIDGQWMQLQMLDNWVFTDDLYSIEAGQTFGGAFSLKMYGLRKLPEGDYRLIVSIASAGEALQPLAVPFTIS